MDFLELIVVSDKVYKFLNKNKIKSNYLPAYVPPKISCRSSLETKYILFAVYKATRQNLIDIYGFDMVMKLVKKISHKYKMLFLVGNKSESDLEFLEATIEEYQNVENIELIFNQRITDFLPKVDCLVRPNRRDGYGVSLQEALEFGVIPLASDVCRRPKGTLTFKNDSFDDFYNKFQVIDKMTLDEKNRILSNKEDLNYHLQLIEIYKSHLLGE